MCGLLWPIIDMNISIYRMIVHVYELLDTSPDFIRKDDSYNIEYVCCLNFSVFFFLQLVRSFAPYAIERCGCVVLMVFYCVVSFSFMLSMFGLCATNQTQWIRKDI